MEIQSTKIFDDIRTMPVQTHGRQVAPSPSFARDTYYFTGGMSANLSFDKERSRSGSVFSGEINGKNAAMKLISPYGKTLLGEGLIGDKQLSICCEEAGHKISGKYNGKDFSLDIDYQEPNKVSGWFKKLLGKASLPDYFNVSGTIGGKEFCINLPFADIPENEEERDILSTVLFVNGYEANSYQNQIMRITYSNQARERMMLAKDKRHKTFEENIKPIIQQSVSMMCSMALPAILSTVGVFLATKLGIGTISKLMGKTGGAAGTPGGVA